MSYPQARILLMTFEKDRVKYHCYKMEDDEVYCVRKLRLNDNTSNSWYWQPETYMSRTNYDAFLRQLEIIPGDTRREV